MKISRKASGAVLAVIIILSLAISTFFVSVKQGYHEDELLTYNLANSSKQLDVSGGWSSPEDFNEYLSVSDEHRFDYAQVYQNQIIDASHPPLYYALVHTVCSLFPNEFNRYFAYSVNVAAMIGILILLYKIGRRISGSNFWALTAVLAYALSIACITTTIYLRMYSTLTFFVLAFIYQSIRLYDRKNTICFADCLLITLIVMLGILTQYYFILFAGLTGLVFLVLKIKERCIKDIFKYIFSAAFGAAFALGIYPFIISNVLGGNRGLGSLELSIDPITIITYLGYKLCTYVQVLAKDLFLNQIWLLLFCLVCALGLGIYFRFFKKKKLNRAAMFVIIPSVVYFIVISILSPFNSDRYVMASLPLISMIFTFVFARFFTLFKSDKPGIILPVSVLLACSVGFATVKPYYTYGKTNLYQPRTKECLFVGTAMLEWNKCIDKLMQYDGAMIVQTDDMSPTLTDELESFAQARGIITNGKIGALAQSYMYNGDTDKQSTGSLKAVKTDERLNKLDIVTVYISRLADGDKVIDYITENTKFKNHELIQADYSFEDFYNWYDYFVETESYCNVYRFSV
ncbi:MAG: glycosyltransferase family 39 protein [Ruminococcus sp.]|nr:glycosyltransferase family 39 protein [Ruminococcus sp.]